MAARWNFFPENIQIANMSGILSGWKYAPVASPADDPEKDAPHLQAQRSWGTTLKESLSSRLLWRILLVLAVMLLVADVFRPQVHSWIPKYPGQEEGAPEHEAALPDHISADVDWSQFAYCQYVTNADYLCNSLMIFESLHRLKSKASRVMMYPESWSPDPSSREGRLLIQARDEYNVQLQPIHVQHFAGDPTWADSFTKLLAFNQTQFARVLSLDSDATILQPMDELFLMPSAPVAMPRAYWLDQPFLSSQLVLVEPSKFEMARVQDAFEHRKGSDFDMEIVNNLYRDDCFIIPHRRYDLLTGEFRSKDGHRKYLGSEEETWDPDAVWKEAKFLHFSDWPLPKPWVHSSQQEKERVAPPCEKATDGTEDCRNKQHWFFAYSDFHDRRERVCGSDFMKRGAGEVGRRSLDVPSPFEPIIA